MTDKKVRSRSRVTGPIAASRSPDWPRDRCGQSEISVGRGLDGHVPVFGVLAPLQSPFGLVAISGIADVDPPAVEADRVDRAAALDQQVDRLAEVVLAAITL